MSKSIALESVLKAFVRTFNPQSYDNRISIGQNYNMIVHDNMIGQ